MKLKRLFGLLATVVLCLSLCACGNPKNSALEHIPDYATAAYMLKFDKDYKFSGSCDEVPKNGIIILYQTSSNTFVVICNSSGKEIREMDNNTIKKHAENVTSTGSHLPYQGDLRFITGCMSSCVSAAKNGAGGEVITNQWYVFEKDELPSK